MFPADIEDGGRGHWPRNAKNACLEFGKGKEMDSILEPPEGTCPASILT